MSESTEMYLETILVIQKKKGHVRSIDIAREMNFSKPTISQQMKRLKEKELVNMAAGGFDVLKEKLAKYRNFEEVNEKFQKKKIENIKKIIDMDEKELEGMNFVQVEDLMRKK